MAWNKVWESTLKDLSEKGYSPETIVADLNSKYSEHTFTYMSVQSKLRRLHDNLDTTKTGKVEGPEEHKILSNGDQTSSILISMNEKEKKDPNFILEAHGFDHEKWQIKSAKSNVWEQAQGKPVYQSKITVSPKVYKFDPELFMKTIQENVKPVDFKVKPNNHKEDVVVIPLADLHFGITTLKDVQGKLDQMCSLIADRKFKKVVIEQLGDLFHSDQMNQAITKNGTNLDDVNMVQALADGQTFYKTLIETALKAGSKVEVKHTQGNHSGDLEYPFLMVLEAMYPQISVEKNIDYRTAYQLTKHVGIMLAHGDVAKKRLPMLFANEYPKIWANTRYREIHTGHYHAEQVTDESGAVKRQFGTPKKADPYEKKNGYTMSNHLSQVLIYGDECLKEIMVIN